MLEIKEFEKVKSFSVFGEISNLGHEQVVFCNDEATGLKAIIAIHNTVLGPALGGTRMWDYASDKDALIDVLRLSRGMTFKAAISGLNLGGGKAVIIGDVKKLKNEALLRRFGKFVESLGGKYITAEDVNMKTSDMEMINMETKHVTGLPENMGGSGDPSPVTAYGVYLGMKATAKIAFGKDSLSGKKVGVQGMGQVGSHLVEHLVKEGAKVYVTDLYPAKVADIVNKYNVEAVGENDIYDLDMDIYAPCALGATINDETIDRLKCQVIAGAANNQLKDEKKHGEMLITRGIAYAPDFVINAGGLMNVYSELIGAPREVTFAKAEGIYTTTMDIFAKAKAEGITTQEAAIKLAMKRINDIGRIKLSY